MRFATKVAVIAGGVVLANVLFLFAAHQSRTQKGSAKAAVSAAPKTHPAAEALPEPRSVQNVLERYAATQEHLRSFILESKTTDTYDINVREDHPMVSAHQSGFWKRYETTNFRFDGERYSLRHRRWGDRNLDSTLEPRDKKAYGSLSWDGEWLRQYRENLWYPQRPHGLIMEPNCSVGEPHLVLSVNYQGAELLGHFARCPVRVDSVLQDACEVKLRDGMEPVAGSPCYVVEASARQGHYVVWFDPAHGFNVAKADIRRSLSQPYFSNSDNPAWMQLERGQEVIITYDGVQFEQVQGTYVPVKARIRREERFSNGDYIKYNKTHEFTRVMLCPDHDNLNSFAPDDITEGTVVQMGDGPNRTGPPKRGVWTNGAPDMSE